MIAFLDSTFWATVAAWLIAIPITASVVADRKHRSSVGWFFACLLLSPLAILPLLAMAPAEPKSPRACPKCKTVNDPANLICRSCGYDFTEGPAEPTEKVCPRCAETVKAAALMCRYCRYAFEAADAAPPQSGYTGS